MKATQAGGDLIPINNCYIMVPGTGEPITFKILPEISDQKSAAYNDEPIIGRAFPLKTYSHSENRSISIQLHFVTIKRNDVETNLSNLRKIQSAVYPRSGGGASFVPPPVCKIKCGEILAKRELCCVLRSYSVKFPTNVVWDEEKLLPMKFDVDTTWEVVYKNSDLPGNDRIVDLGA